MARATHRLLWPWHWLTTREVSRFDILESVLPTADVGQHNPEIQLYAQTFVMIAGTNTILLPGLSRAAELNPAALPLIQSRGARRWLAITAESNTATATPLMRLAYVRGPSSPAPDIYTDGNTLAANAQRSLVGSPSVGGTIRIAARPSVYVPDPFLLRFSITGQAGGEVLQLRGIFLESDDSSEPLPALF